jgi:hypothetical protein
MASGAILGTDDEFRRHRSGELEDRMFLGGSCAPAQAGERGGSGERAWEQCVFAHGILQWRVAKSE